MRLTSADRLCLLLRRTNLRLRQEDYYAVLEDLSANRDRLLECSMLLETRDRIYQA